MYVVSCNSEEVKKMASALGVDVCGIANVERFEGAPAGHRPQDIFPECRSVIVLAKRIPVGLLHAKTPVPSTQANMLVNQELDVCGVSLALALEDAGMKAVPLPCDAPYEHWEADREYGMGLLSMRHAGYLAGIGVIGRNTLLKNEKYGSMIKVGAVLVDAALEPDPILDIEPCPPKCRICLDSCPANALDGVTADQKRCRSNSVAINGRGFSITVCSTCRRVCPEVRGIKRAQRTQLLMAEGGSKVADRRQQR
jgi:epoxyqueuosine reductase QueG